MKYIPTISIVFFKDTELYGYEYIDINDQTQVEYGYPNVDAALGNAFKRLKTFTVLEDIETK